MAFLFKQSGSNRWWLGFRVDGKLHRHSTGHIKRSDADEVLQHYRTLESVRRKKTLLNKFVEALTGEEKAIPRAADYIDSWFRAKSREVSSNTRKIYHRAIQELKTYLTERGIETMDEITQATLSDFLRQCAEQLGKSSVDRRKNILRQIFTRAKREKVIQDDPSDGLKSPLKKSTVKKVRRPFTQGELKTLLNHSDLFWRFMIIGGCTTGLRLGDLVSLSGSDIDLDEMVIRCSTIKTGAVVTIPISEQLAEEIRPRVVGAGPLFPKRQKQYSLGGSAALSRAFADLLISAGLRERSSPIQGGRKRAVNELSFHCLRHSFISALQSAGVAEQITAGIVGHSTVAMTRQYTTIATETLRQAVSAIPEVGS